MCGGVGAGVWGGSVGLVCGVGGCGMCVCGVCVCVWGVGGAWGNLVLLDRIVFESFVSTVWRELSNAMIIEWVGCYIYRHVCKAPGNIAC